jgi:hypothetical protein
MINVDPPPATGYIPPTEIYNSPTVDRNLDPTIPAEGATRPRAVSQPPPTNGHRKSVQFAAKDDIQGIPSSDASIPDHDGHHHRRRRKDRGYEAGEDTDTPTDEASRRGAAAGGAAAAAAASLDPVEDYASKRRHHRRRRSHDPASGSSSSRRDRDRDPTSDPKGKTAERSNTGDGNDSDATVDLPARFDEKGQKKTERGEDPLADKFEDIISGKGAAGKVFGNFMDGLFGPEGRKRR